MAVRFGRGGPALAAALTVSAFNVGIAAGSGLAGAALDRALADREVDIVLAKCPTWQTPEGRKIIAQMVSLALASACTSSKENVRDDKVEPRVPPNEPWRSERPTPGAGNETAPLRPRTKRRGLASGAAPSAGAGGAVADDLEAGLAWHHVLAPRGVPLARRLAARVEALEGVQVPVGILDTTMYRDDVRLRGTPSIVRRTDILFDVNDCHIVLVDDVLYTGRSARAALDALMDIGRPASVRFLCIVDRGLRELPVTADIVGLSVPTLPDERVRVRLHELDDREGVWLVGVSNVA